MFVWLLLNVVVFATYVLQKVLLLLAKHGVHLPCMLFIDFLLTLPFSINLVPMSLSFGGRLKLTYENKYMFVAEKRKVIENTNTLSCGNTFLVNFLIFF